jgi:hypothetical protein
MFVGLQPGDGRANELKKSGAAISIGFRRLARPRHHILSMYHDVYVPLAALRGH